MGEILAVLGSLGGLAGLAALVRVFRVERSHSESEEHSVATEQKVDADVLAKFLELTTRIANLESQLASTQVRLDNAVDEIRELRKLEEYLQAKLHEKDKEIAEQTEARALLQAELQLARDRIKHLEEICKRAGLNGDE